MRKLGNLIFLVLCSSSLVMAAGVCDVTTGASVKVVGIRTTPTTATITWTEGRHNGGRLFAYGLSKTTYGPFVPVQSRASNAKDERVLGLTADTKYFFEIHGWWGNKVNQVVSGSWFTKDSVCGTSVLTTVEVNGTILSDKGDSLENVVVAITNSTTGVIVGKDYTDRSGGFAFRADPNKYNVTFSYPPFTSPPVYVAQVVSGKNFLVPNQILKDAFQLGGTVLPSVGGVGIKGALVTVTSKTDASIIYERQTDPDGHFNVGVKAGDYLINAVYSGKSIPAPITINVAASKEIAPLVLSATVGISSHPKFGAGASKTAQDGFNAKGARHLKKTAHPVHVIQFNK